MLKFLTDNIALLITASPILNKQVTNDNIIQRLSGRHFPHIKKAKAGALDQRPSKPCRVCSARGIRTAKGKYLKSVYILCKSCPSEPGLHPEVCFEAYHTMLDYSKV